MSGYSAPWVDELDKAASGVQDFGGVRSALAAVKAATGKVVLHAEKHQISCMQAAIDVEVTAHCIIGRLHTKLPNRRRF